MSTLLKKDMPAGGQRKGAGRKPVEDEKDKKVQLTFYVKKKNKSTIKAVVEPIVKKLDK